MSAKRPRPAIPVLVHVDNPAEVGSVVVDTSTIEGKMDTVITNQNRIYDKIPTSSGGGSADLTTVNEKITTLATAVGPANSTTGDRNLIGHVINLVGSIGDFNAPVSQTGSTVRGFLNNIRNAVGSSAADPTTTGTSVRDLLLQIKTATGTLNSSSKDTDLIGCVRNLRVSVGASGNQLLPSGDSIRAFLLNLCKAVGNSYDTPTATENTVRGLLTAIKENTASGGGGGGGSADLTIVNEKTTALAAAIGTTDSTYTSDDLLGRIKNLTSSIGDFYLAPTATGSTIRDLLTAIKQNTASGGGGGGGSADLTTVNEKTTALATAIGSADDSSSTVSVIGLLKSITDKY